MNITVSRELPEAARQIRQKVFVEEQGFCDEIDGTDDRAEHFVIYQGDSLPAATCRVFWDDGIQGYVLGRFAVLPEYRRQAVGTLLLKEVERHVQKAGGKSITLHAQCPVSGFYQKLGFTEYGDVEDVQGCPHVWMRKELVPDVLTVNGKEYPIIKLLGKGKGGYSYLAADGDIKVVLKQIHHEPCAYYQFGDKLASELRDYERLQSIDIPLPKLLAVDRQAERIIKEYIDGKTVYEMVLSGKLPTACIKQVREMCRKLYPANTNIDYFPTNFVWQGDRLYYIDYECNDYMEEWNFENWGIKYWSRTPELLQYAKDRAGNI